MQEITIPNKGKEVRNRSASALLIRGARIRSFSRLKKTVDSDDN